MDLRLGKPKPGRGMSECIKEGDVEEAGLGNACVRATVGLRASKFRSEAKAQHQSKKQNKRKVLCCKRS